MNNSEDNNKLLAKLSLQTQSFQEGFKNLVVAKTFPEMTKIFTRLLKGSFLLKNVYVLHKKNVSLHWENIGINKKIELEVLDTLNNVDASGIRYLEHDKFSCAIVLNLADKSVLGIVLFKKLNNTDLNLFDKITLQIFLQVFDSAYATRLDQKEIKKLVFELNEKIFQLNKLVETGLELSKLENKDNLYNLALERVVSITNASSAIISIKPENQDEKQTKYYCFPYQADIGSILNNDSRIESSFKFNEKIYTLILSEKEIRGGTTTFNKLDSVLLEAISGQILTSIKNEYFLKQSIEKERIEKELSLAASIQRQIIPQELPNIEGFEISGLNYPSKEVGGDYYDFIKLGNDKYALVIADVTGKGIAAALLVNTLNAALYSYLSFDLNVSEITEKLNKLIFNSTPQDTFITFFIGVIDLKTGIIDIVNAGHNPALVYRKNDIIEEIKAGALALGMFDLGLPCTSQQIKLESQETLFLFTDGIPEAKDIFDNVYSDEKMIMFFENNQNQKAEQFTQALLSDVRKFAEGADQSDDITMLVLKRIK